MIQEVIPHRLRMVLKMQYVFGNIDDLERTPWTSVLATWVPFKLIGNASDFYVISKRL